MNFEAITTNITECNNIHSLLVNKKNIKPQSQFIFNAMQCVLSDHVS